MAYRLESNESLDEGLRRIAYEQIDDAIKKLEEPIDDIHDSIHEARKDLKKVRALLRLIRFSLGKDFYNQENVFYRDLGRMLSDIRDAHVAIETLELLEDKFDELKDDQDIPTLKKRLEKREAKIIKQKTDEEDAVKQVCKHLTDTRKRIENWPTIPNRFTSIKNGMKKVYKRGFKGLDNSQANPRKDQFHEWRKRVKYLWYNHRILNFLWPEILNTWAEAIHDLSDYLGDEHDLANFKEIIYEPEIHKELNSKAAELAQFVQDHREELQKKSLKLGLKLYSETPDAFINRFENYWQAEREFTMY